MQRNVRLNGLRNDKENIVYQGRLEETVVYRELYGMAEEPVRTRI